MGVNATLQGNRVTSARVSVPAWGLWFAEVSVDGEVTLAPGARVDLKIADVAFKGTILSGGPHKGRSTYRVVAGAGGWGKSIKRENYADDLGTRVAKVLVDAAALAGESVDTTTVATSLRTGPGYTRPEGPASQVLEERFPKGWYVDVDGVTRIGKRPAVPFTASVPRVSPVDLARRTVTIAPETIAALVPGVVVDGLEAVDVLHELTPEGLRTTIRGSVAAGSSRRLDAERALIERLFPELLYKGIFEFRVQTQEGERLNLQPTQVSTGMPELRRVPVRPGLSGARADIALGARVLVQFINDDPSRPVVTHYEDPEADGFLPLLTEIDAQTFVRLGAGALPAIRSGDLAGGIWPCAPTQVKVAI